MRIFNMIILIAVFIFGVYQMKKSSSIIRTDWFKGLSYDERIKTTSKIKANWKCSILLLAVVVSEMLILISSFIGKTHYYENIINLSMLVVSIIVTILLIINNKNLNKDIKK